MERKKTREKIEIKGESCTRPYKRALNTQKPRSKEKKKLRRYKDETLKKYKRTCEKRGEDMRRHT